MSKDRKPEYYNPSWTYYQASRLRHILRTRRFVSEISINQNGKQCMVQIPGSKQDSPIELEGHALLQGIKTCQLATERDLRSITTRVGSEIYIGSTPVILIGDFGLNYAYNINPETGILERAWDPAARKLADKILGRKRK